MMRGLKALVASALFTILLPLVYYAHVTLFKVDVVLYSAILDGVLATIVAGVLLIWHRYFSPLSGLEKSLLVLCWLMGGYIFAISIPTVIDRSLSFYILEKLQQRGGGIQLSRFEEVFTKEYVKEHRLVDVRLTEQKQSGTITIADGCVQLTERGQRLATWSRAFRKNFLPKQRLLMGKYTEDLTDPFRSSIPEPGYSCRLPMKADR